MEAKKFIAITGRVSDPNIMLLDYGRVAEVARHALKPNKSIWSTWHRFRVT